MDRADRVTEMPVKVKVKLGLRKGVHPPDAIKVQFNGPRASNISIDHLKKGVCDLINLNQPLINFNEISTVKFEPKMIIGFYRLQQPHTVYMRIASNSPLTRSEMYIRSAAAPDFQVVDEKGTPLVRLRISDPTVEPTRVFLNYCPTHILDDPEDYRTILAAIVPERYQENTTILRNIKDRQDRHLLLINMPPTEAKDIPHYIEYTADDGTDDRILITIPGRLPLCHICEVDTHHPSQCKKKKTDQPLKAYTDLAVQTDQPRLKSARTQTSDSMKRPAPEQESSSQENETTSEYRRGNSLGGPYRLYTIAEIQQINPTHVIDMKDSHPRYKTNRCRLEQEYECVDTNVTFGKWTEDGWMCFQKPNAYMTKSFIRVSQPNLDTTSRQGSINTQTRADDLGPEPVLDSQQSRKDKKAKK